MDLENFDAVPATIRYRRLLADAVEKRAFSRFRRAKQ
jgi:hypothetical protein